MKILLIGSGGREDALAWKLKQSPLVSKLYCAPGNPGVGRYATLVPIAVDKLDELKAFATRESIDLTIVGPELPLTLGIVDEFQKHGLKIFGPSQQAARIEGSKEFAKDIMIAAGVPTSTHRTFEAAEALRDFLTSCPLPSVVKADGLASGKGVFICTTREECLGCVDTLFDDLKSEKVVVEEFLHGVEASFIIATDGDRIVPLATAHDYKRIFENDQGPNTGGMGTVSPTPRLSSEQESWAVEHVIRPVLQEMHRRGVPFSGFLYAGLMIAPDGSIKVLEFNARLGDPETQVILRRLDSDLVQMLSALTDKSELEPVQWNSQHAQCVVLASAGYPQQPRGGDEIYGINLAENLSDVAVFHAGTARGKMGELVTAGGRVLNVTAIGASAVEARALAYRGVDMIQFKGLQARRDIGIR